MKNSKPVFIADSCIGGLSVVKSMWDSGIAADAVFMADYAVNPLGLKSDSAIADVIYRWLRLAEEHSDTLIIACNTLSVRYYQLLRSGRPVSGLSHIVSMVDCFETMVQMEADRLADRRVLVISTEYTASQRLYLDILCAAVPGVRTDTIAATALERAIARFESWDNADDTVLTSELRRAIGNADVAVLACTCFPMVTAELESLFQGITFLDPSAYCAGLLQASAATQDRKLRIKVTGETVLAARVADFAKSYLGEGDIECCI